MCIRVALLYVMEFSKVPIMDDNGGSYEVKEVASSVPVFLLKLVSMLNDSDNHEFVDWTPSGTSFIVKDQVQFSKIVLPKYFKHNKFASFVRQLNMYGFRKITALTQTGMAPDRDEVEFYHNLFVRNEEHLLSQIKRKVNKPDALSRTEDVSKVLESVKEIQSYQDVITHRLSGLKQENEELWREVMSLRQKHAHQQKVVNKLIQFLVNLVHQTGMGVKRRLPLMIDDGSSESLALPKVSKPTIYVEESSGKPSSQESSEPIVSFPGAIGENDERANDSGPHITEVTSPSSGGNMAPTISVVDYQDADQPRAHHGMSEIPQSDAAWIPEEMKSSYQQPNYNSDRNLPLAQLSPPTRSQIAHQSVTTQPEPAITQYYPTDSRLSLGDLTNDVHRTQNSIDSIQDTLFNNYDVGLDSNLLQELFGGYPDAVGLFPENVQLPKEPSKGTEVVLHNRQSQENNNDFAADLSDLTDYL